MFKQWLTITYLSKYDMHITNIKYLYINYVSISILFNLFIY